MAYAIKRAFRIDPPATVSASTVRVLQSHIASAWGVLEVSVLGDITGKTLTGLQVAVVVDAIDGDQAGKPLRKAILEGIRSAGLSRRSFRVASGSGREV